MRNFEKGHIPENLEDIHLPKAVCMPRKLL